MTPAPVSTAPSGSIGSTRHYALVLAALLVVAAGLRLQGIDRSLSIDEAWAIKVARAPDFWPAAREDVHPPLYYFLLRLGHGITTSFSGLRLFSIGCGLGLLALAVLAFRKTPAAAVVAGAAVAALPGFVLFAQQLRSYALLFLLLALALALAVKIFRGAPDARTRILLSLVLMAAAATHLITVFFLLALSPLLLRPAGAANARRWIAALLPLVPAGLLALWFKYYFITQPGSQGGGWWLAVDARSIFNAARDVFGWSEMQWLADAWSRHAPGNVWPVLVGAIAAALVAVSTAWGRRPADPLGWALLASAAIYALTVMAYSSVFEHVVMMRTLLPGLLPFIAALALGIGTHPVAWRRTLAAAAVVGYVALTAIPVVRLAAMTEAGLRGLSAEVHAAGRPGDLLVQFRALDYGLAAYGGPPAGILPLQFDQTQPAQPQLLELRRRLDQLGPRSRVLVVYRDDYYLQQFRDVFEQALGEISAHGQAPRTVWQEADLALMVADAPTVH